MAKIEQVDNDDVDTDVVLREPPTCWWEHK